MEEEDPCREVSAPKVAQATDLIGPWWHFKPRALGSEQEELWTEEQARIWGGGFLGRGGGRGTGISLQFGLERLAEMSRGRRRDFTVLCKLMLLISLENISW